MRRRYFGDGATSEGDPHEAMNFAGVYERAVVFFVQNNQYAISVPLLQADQARRSRTRPSATASPASAATATTSWPTYAVARAAVDRARAGEGPTLIEAVTYRMEAHTTADDPTRYRTAEELERVEPRDPIARFETFLTKEGLLDDELEGEIDTEAAGLRGERMREEIYDAPHGDPLELFEHVYVDPPPILSPQRRLLARARRASGEG